MTRKAGAVSRRRHRREEVRFRPPAVFLSREEILVPLVHTSFRQLADVGQVLNGSSFYVKVLDPTPNAIPGGHMMMAKFKPLKLLPSTPEEKSAFKAEGKVTGRILGEVEGLQITANIQRAKRAGKDRIWIQVRQKDPKRWRVSEALSYARAVDLQFEKSE